MTKIEFLNQIGAQLAGLPAEEIQKTLDFYSEAIDDRMEDGLTEEQAILALGTPEEIAQRTLMDTPLPQLIKAQNDIRPKRELKAWQVVLIILGAPVWLPLTISLVAVALSLILAVIAVIIGLVASVAASAVFGTIGVFASLAGLVMGQGSFSLMMLGTNLIVAGIAVLLFIPIKAGAIWLFEGIGRLTGRIKQHFINKRTRQM